MKILRMTSVPDSGSPVLVLTRLGKSWSVFPEMSLVLEGIFSPFCCSLKLSVSLENSRDRRPRFQVLHSHVIVL